MEVAPAAGDRDVVGPRLRPDRGAAGLQPSAPPAVSDIPNNHRSYAVQWFAFAIIAVVIYALALRGRQRSKQ